MADPLGVSVAFTADPMVVTPSWTRIDTLTGCRVRSWTIDRGRPNEFAKTDTGTATVRVVDRAGLFDPTNASSPYVGNLKPGKQAAIALQNPIGDVWHTLFRGFIESWSYKLDQTRQFMELELQLVDGFAILSRVELQVGVDGAQPGPPPYTSPPYATVAEAEREAKLAELAQGNVLYGETLNSVDERILGILSDAGWPAALADPGVDVFSGNVRVGPKAYGPGTFALDALWDAVDGEFPGVGNCWMSKDGHFMFRGRQARFRPEVAEYGIAERTVGDPSATSLDPDVVPVSELEWTNGQDNLFNACSATPQGVGSGLAWRPLNPDPPDNDDIAGQYVTDPASITAHGLRGLAFDNLQTIEGMATGNTALEETFLFAQYYVDNYATPAPRISRMVFKSRRPGDTLGPALWLHLCRCELSDLLTLKTDHPGGGGFDDEFYVEGIHYIARPLDPDYPMIELALDVSPRAHYANKTFDADTDP